MESPNWVANGNILPSRFVTADTTAEFRVKQSVADEFPIGISGEGTLYPQLPAPLGATLAFAGAAGFAVKVYGEGNQCLLVAGAGGWVSGQLLKPDLNGAGLPVSTTVHEGAGARALSNCNAGELGRVQVLQQREGF